jgi:AraC-like DNA-binding protein
MAPETGLLQLATLFDYLADIIVWVKDRQGVYVWVNRAFLVSYEANRLPGHPTSSLPQITGRTDYDLSPAFLADQYRLDDEYVLAGNRIVNRIELVEQTDGPAEWSVTNKIPLLDRMGTVIGTAGMTRQLKPMDHEQAATSGFGPVLTQMRNHYQAPLHNRQLAAVAHMSVRAFERKFHSAFHLTPQQYLRRLRLSMASRALVFTAQSLADIAAHCGFSDQSHFTREFRRHFGRTPREYREYYARA